MTLQLNGTTGLTFNDGSLQPSAAINKNIIINGNMNIAQRATSVTGITTTGYRTVDRFQQVISSAGTWTQTQSAEAPTGEGFYNSLKFQCTTANASLAAGAFNIASTSIEGFNLQQLGYGAAGAKSVTFCFWVRAKKTGTYILGIYRPTANRQISTAYTISVADTWEKKTITIPGDTSGAIANAATEGFRISWWLGAGSNFSSGTLQTSWNTLSSATRAVGQVNLADSTSNYFQITGVQLEIGTTATPFEHLQYGQQLALCQRYFQYWYHMWNGVAFLSEDTTNHTSFMTEMRNTPTVVRTGGTFDTRYPSGNWLLLYITNASVASRVRAGSAGGNDGWRANGTLEAEL